jgi:hypothetical protein
VADPVITVNQPLAIYSSKESVWVGGRSMEFEVQTISLDIASLSAELQRSGSLVSWLHVLVVAQINAAIAKERVSLFEALSCTDTLVTALRALHALGQISTAPAVA